MQWQIAPLSVKGSEGRNRNGKAFDVRIGGLDTGGGNNRATRSRKGGNAVRPILVLQDGRRRIDGHVVGDGVSARLLVQVQSTYLVVGPRALREVVDVVVLDFRPGSLIGQGVDRRTVGQDVRDVVNVVVVDLVASHRIGRRGPPEADRDPGIIGDRYLVVLYVDLLWVSARDATGPLDFRRHVVDIVVLDRVVGANLVLVGRIVRHVKLGGFVRHELPDGDSVAAGIGEHVTND